MFLVKLIKAIKRKTENIITRYKSFNKTQKKYVIIIILIHLINGILFVLATLYIISRLR